jgi:hypothetical protein
LHTLKNILKRYAAWIAKVPTPLGPWGVFALPRSMAFSMPVDAVVAGYVYHDRSRFLLYVAGFGRVGDGELGDLRHWLFGGETVLRESRRNDCQNHASFERHEFWAMFPRHASPTDTVQNVRLGSLSI